MVNAWLNADSLYQKFGTSEAQSVQQAGFQCTYGPYHTTVLNLDLTLLDQTEAIQNDVTVIPANSLIESVEVITIVAAAAGTAIDLGLIANDRTTTTDLNASITDADPDGLLAAFVTASMSEAGEYTRVFANDSIPTGTTNGALIGKILTVPTLVTCSRTDATAFTAGKVQIRINTIPMATTGFGAVH